MTLVATYCLALIIQGTVALVRLMLTSIPIFPDPDITLDGATAQVLDKSGNGNLTLSLTQNTATNRFLSITSTNAGSGTLQC